MKKSRWNNDLAEWISERHYSKDEVDGKLKYDSLQSILTLSWVISSFVSDTGVVCPVNSVDEFIDAFDSWCVENNIDLESLI